MKTILFLIILALVPAGANETADIVFANKAFSVKDGKKTLLKKGDRISLESKIQTDKGGGLGLGYNKKIYSVDGGTDSTVAEIIKGSGATGYKDSSPTTPGSVRGVEEEKKRLAEEERKLKEERVKRNSPKTGK